MSASPAPPFKLLDELHVRIFITAHVNIHTNWNAQNVYSSYWRLYLNDRDGAAAILLPDRERYELPPGKIHFIPAWVRFSCHNTELIKHCYIHFDLMGLPTPTVRQIFNRPFTLPNESHLDALAKLWADDMMSRNPLDLEMLCRAKSLIYLSLSSLTKQLTPEQHARCCRHLLGRHALMPAIDYIEENLHETLDNRQLAKLCHLSEDHFIRSFRQVVGQTPAQYILDRRVSTAAQRLVFGNESVDQIAEQCGFRDRYYFSRVFARRMGSPPATYRKTDRV